MYRASETLALARTMKRTTQQRVQMARAKKKRNSVLEDIVAANRILSDQAVLDTWGHVSARDPANPERFWMSRSLAPALVQVSDILQFDLAGEPIGQKAQKVYLERFIHTEIYRARPD